MRSDKTLIVDYSARGVGMTDAQVEPFVDALIERVNKSAGDTRVIVGCELIVEAICAAVASGKLNDVEVDMFENGEHLSTLDSYGRFIGKVVPTNSLYDKFGEIMFDCMIERDFPNGLAASLDDPTNNARVV